MIIVTAAEMRRLDALTIERFGTPGRVLMERAGIGATDVLCARFPEVRRGRVVVVAGKGNNGGDGFVIARELRRRKIAVEVVLLGATDEVCGDAADALRAYGRARGPLSVASAETAAALLADRLPKATLVVDAVFGTGLNAPVRGWIAAALAAINACGRPVFAVDLPSGLDADRGVALGNAVRAVATATFAFPKVAHVVYPGLEYTGSVDVVDIGIPAEAVALVAPRLRMNSDAIAALLPRRTPEAHKGTCGHVLVLAGSIGHTGAARLATRAALRSGAGLVTMAGPASLNVIFACGGDEWMTAPLPDTNGQVRHVAAALKRVMMAKSVVVAGPGLGTHADAAKVIRYLLQHAPGPIVLDADALTCVASDLPSLRRARVPLVVTPHPGEMARLLATDTATVQADRIGAARTFAAAHGVVVVLKGARTVISTADGKVWINPTGNPGMATGGMGDVLAGVIGALLGQGLEATAAARLGVFVHGLAADRVAARRGVIGLLAHDVVEELPPTIAALASAGGNATLELSSW